MSSPVKNDWAHAWLRIREFARVWYNLRLSLAKNLAGGDTYAANEQAVLSDGCVFDPDVDQGEKVGWLQQRSAVATAFAVPRAVLDPLMLQLSRAMGYPQTDPVAVIPILFLYMSRNLGSFKSPPRVQPRTFTRGSWTANGSNQGNGTVLRLTVDEYGNPIESDQPDVLQFEVIADSNGRTNPGQEQFKVTGLPFRDQLSLYTTGYSIGVGNKITAPNLVGVTCDATQDIVDNPSFNSFSGTGATSSFALSGNWTISNAANCSVDTTHYYRASNQEGSAPGALKITATTTLTYTIPAGKLKEGLAYCSQLAVNFSQFSGTGSVAVTIGNMTTFTVNSGVGGWNLLRPTLDKFLHYKNIVTGASTGAVTITIVVTVSGGTAILIDDFQLQPFQSIAGKLLWTIGGSTNWVTGDRATITDSVPTTNGVPTTGLVQTLLSEAYGECLPAYTSFVAAPAAPSGASTSGGTSGGAYVVSVTHYNATTGQESFPSVALVVYVQASGRISLTGIPTGPAGTTARYVYVSQPSDVNISSDKFATEFAPREALYFAQAIADNVTTTLTFDPDATIDLTKPLSVLNDIT